MKYNTGCQDNVTNKRKREIETEMKKSVRREQRSWPYLAKLCTVNIAYVRVYVQLPKRLLRIKKQSHIVFSNIK